MALYYFDVHDRRGIHKDTEGQDMPDLDTVRRGAMAILPQIAFEIEEDGDHQKIVVIARDQYRNAVYTATLSYSGEWVGPPG